MDDDFEVERELAALLTAQEEGFESDEGIEERIEQLLQQEGLIEFSPFQDITSSEEAELILPKGLTFKRKLGGGAFGQVLLCYHEYLHTEVALKIRMLRPDIEERLNEYGFDQDEPSRREAEIYKISRKNPHMPEILWAGEENGFLFIAEKPIDGITLQDYLKKRPNRIALYDVAKNMLTSLAGIHSDGIVHNDIKPSNIMIKKDGTVIIIDFNTFFRVGEPAFVKGSFPYRAPEVFSDKLSQSSDVYAGGVTLFQMFVGNLPFQSPQKDWSNLSDYQITKQQAILQRRIQNQPLKRKEMKKIQGSLRQVVRKALEKAPQNRYPDFLAMQEDVKQIQKNKVYTLGTIATLSVFTAMYHNEILSLIHKYLE